MDRHRPACPPRVAIIGAGVAGVRTALALRRRAFAGEVVLLGAETRTPYDRPPLITQILSGSWQPELAGLVAPGQLDDMGIELRPGCRAVGLGPAGVRLADNRCVEADFVVLATGSVPHHLADEPRDPRIHRIGTLDDVLRLRDVFGTASSLLVIGAGLTGGEVATVAHDAGLRVDIVEAGPKPFVRTLGPAGGRILAARHRDRGVRIHPGRWVESWHTGPSGIGLELDDGMRLSAQHAVIATGARPALDWLVDGPGTDRPVLQANLEQGLACDSDGRVIGTSTLYAVGDSAAWTDPGTGVRSRAQHWTRAIEQAEVVAAVIAARADEPSPADHIPDDHRETFPTIGPAYMWTDQAGTRIQVIGDPHLGEQQLVLQADDTGTVVITCDRGHTVAVTLIGTPRALPPARAAVADAVPAAQAVELIGARIALRPTTVDTLVASS
ncbi:NAD(P)/FAD-dependent oxidoreductase [Mycobacterium sp. NPDC003449]